MAASAPGLFRCGAVDDGAGGLLRPGGGGIIGLLFEQAGLRLGADVLDVGCGAGESLAWLERHGYRGTGVDRDETALALAASRTAAALFHADGCRLPFADGGFDAVLSECSLSLMADRRAALAEWHRVLKPDGRLLLADVDWPDAAGGDPFRDDVLAAGFAVLHGADRSDVLAGFAARFVFRYGSLDALWGDDCRRPGKRPRYRLLVGRKMADTTVSTGSFLP